MEGAAARNDTRPKLPTDQSCQWVQFASSNRYQGSFPVDKIEYLTDLKNIMVTSMQSFHRLLWFNLLLQADICSRNLILFT